MSGLLRPVGPEDPQVYWLRRAAILVGLVLVVVVVVALIRPGGSTRMAEPSASPTPLLLATRSATATPEPAATPAPEATVPVAGQAETPPAEATPSAPPTCAPRDLRLALGGAEDAGLGTPTTFSVQLTNGSAGPCSIAWEPGTAELRITSGSDRIWSTDDCDRWFTAVPAQVIEPGQALTAQVAWQGQRSYPGCKLASKPLQPGTYVATVEVDGAATAEKVLRLG